MVDCTSDDAPNLCPDQCQKGSFSIIYQSFIDYYTQLYYLCLILMIYVYIFKIKAQTISELLKEMLVKPAVSQTIRIVLSRVSLTTIQPVVPLTTLVELLKVVVKQIKIV